MKSVSNIFLVIMAVVLATGCNNYNYKKTESGLIYSIVSKGNKKLQPGEFVKVHYKALIGDSVLFDSYSGMPAYGQYDTTTKNVHDFIDFFGEMGVGDSAEFVRSIDTMQARGYLMYNDVFKKGGTIKGYITILKTYPTREAMMEDQQAEVTKLKEKQIVELENYLKEKQITGAIKTPKGTFVKMDVEGTGPKVDSGMLVVVNYTGALKNGNKFDSNTDSAFGHVSPFEFKVGAGSVIEGWDEAIRYFKQGGKGKIFIPSMLGYGSNAQGDKLPAFSDLVFDIEVLAVKPADAPTIAPKAIGQ